MDDQRKTLIVIPTYNEVENIDPLLDGIWEHAPETDVLFVDDNSPDGTGARIESARIRSPQSVHLIRRPEKLGLGTAYIAGFQWALESDYGVLVQMDADLSHDLFPVRGSRTSGGSELRDTLRGLEPRGGSRNDKNEEAVDRSGSEGDRPAEVGT